jgi:hypothetical protein
MRSLEEERRARGAEKRRTVRLKAAMAGECVFCAVDTPWAGASGRRDGGHGEMHQAGSGRRGTSQKDSDVRRGGKLG